MLPVSAARHDPAAERLHHHHLLDLGHHRRLLRGALFGGQGGIIGLTRALAKEVGPSGIRVNCIAPGVIDTEMNGNLTPEVMAQLREETPLGTIGTPKQVADLALYLAGEGASFLTGQVISPNGGFLI